MDPRETVMKYNGPRLPIYYNQFFNPNVCHVCKSIGAGNLIQCDQCRMIFYCNEEHRQVHKTQHQEICEIIVKHPTVIPQLDKACEPLTLCRWIRAKRKCIKLLKQILLRHLEPYEEEMIMCAKSCFICYLSNSSRMSTERSLQVCKKCYSANYCIRHKFYFTREHKQFDCRQLKLLLNTSIATMTNAPVELTQDFMKFLGYPNLEDPLIDTVQLISRFLTNTNKMRKASPYWTADDYVLSDWVSGPLTLYHVINTEQLFRTRVTDVFIVHIINATFVNKNHLFAWELLLHCVLEIRQLNIIMVGVRLKPSYIKYKLCQTCCDSNKKLSVTSVSQFYHDYANSSEFKQPNVIVLSEIKLDASQWWSKCIREIQVQACPLLLACSDVLLADNNIRKINQILGTNVMLHREIKNRFSSHAPRRDFQTDDLCYYNRHIVIYKTLNDFRVFSRY